MANAKSEDKLIIHDIRDKIFWAIRVRYTLVLLGLALLYFAFFNQIPFGQMPALLAFVGGYNLLAHLLHRLIKPDSLWRIIALRGVFQVCDVLSITFLVYFTGGLESPYWFLYLVLIVISGFGVYSYPAVSVFVIAIFSAVFYLGLLWLTYQGILPTYGPTFTLTPSQLLQSVFNKAIFTTVSIFLFSTTIYYFTKLIYQHRQQLAQKNRELLATLEELKEIDRLKDDFVSTASHELRTPLSVVRENMSLIEDGVMGQTNKKQSELLKVSRLNVDRLASILDSLLDISKIESRSLELKRENVDLAWLASRAIELLQSKAQEKKIAISAKLPDKMKGWVDPDQILRVFINLIDNAIKYSDEKGLIEVGLEGKDNSIQGYVLDNGIGIAEADADKVFDRFVRLASDKYRVVKGTGLGLSICKGIIEMHGGRIWVESEQGKGSKFIFSLPRVET